MLPFLWPPTFPHATPVADPERQSLFVVPLEKILPYLYTDGTGVPLRWHQSDRVSPSIALLRIDALAVDTKGGMAQGYTEAQL